MHMTCMDVQVRATLSIYTYQFPCFSKDTHFVLELIQNADDNDYPSLLSADQFDVTDGTEPPSVLFRVQRDKISVFNNETGFKVPIKKYQYQY